MSHGAEHVLILAGDHIYKMDYAAMLAWHIQRGADVTVPCVEVPRMKATGFGVMHVDDTDQVVSFLEKPADPPAIPGQPDRAVRRAGLLREDRRARARPQHRDHARGRRLDLLHARAGRS